MYRMHVRRFHTFSVPLNCVKSKNKYCEILGVSKNCTREELKNCFIKNAKLWHPDLNKDPKATEKFTKLNEAYQNLKNSGLSNLKQSYFTYGQKPSYSDLLKNKKNDRREKISKTYGRADRVSLDPILQVSFAEAVMGATKETMAKTPELCESCKAIKPFVDGCKPCKTKGFRTVNRSAVRVNVPPGAADGQKVTVNLNNKLLTIELKVNTFQRDCFNNAGGHS